MNAYLTKSFRPMGYVFPPKRAYWLVLLCAILSGCATTTTRRVLDDGTVVESSSYGLTERAGRVAETAAGYYLRVPVQPTK